MKKRNIQGLLNVIDKYFNPSAGQVPILMIDTGTLIDLEEYAKRSGFHRAPHKTAGEFFSQVCDLARCVVFPRGVYREIEEHHSKSFKNGKPEIGKEIYDIACAYNEVSKDLLEETAFLYHYSVPYRDEVNKLQEIVEILHREVNGGRKGEKKVNGKDPISNNDLEFLNSAVRLGVKSLFQFRLNQNESGDMPAAIDGTYRIAVLSPDSHIYKPLNIFITRPEGVSYRDYLQAFNPREYIK